LIKNHLPAIGNHIFCESIWFAAVSSTGFAKGVDLKYLTFQQIMANLQNGLRLSSGKAAQPLNVNSFLCTGKKISV
jgi:hypothetical protein